MANGAFKFKDNSGNVVSHISGSGANIYFSGGTLDLSGMTGLTLGGLTISGSIQNAQTASLAPSYLLTSSFNTYSSSYAITGSNTFIGNQTISGSIIPAVSASYDLGSVNYPFRHLYLSSASLYVNGTKVLGSTAQELQITTDAGQSFKILESSSDTITLQSADGNITLATSGGGDVIMDPTNGVIGLKGTVTVYTGNKVVSSDGNSIQFGNGIAITGSIVSTVTPLVSGSSQIIYSGLTGIPSGIISGSSQLTSSYDGRYVLSGSITQTTWDNIASKPSGIASGSSQIDITGTTGYSTFSSSISTSIGGLSSSVATTTSGLSSSVGSLSSSVATTTSGLSSSVATTTLGTKNRVDSIEAKTGSYATTGSNIFKDNQTISGSLIVTQNLTVFGSSSITYVTSSQLRVDDNIITLNTSSPGSRFGGLEVYDSGSVTQATGSILWDSVNNRWIYQQSSEATYGGGVLMSGPRSSGSLGSELTLTSGRVAKSAGGDHLNDSNITDDGTLVSINSNTEVTGTLKVTSTITGTLSGNASTATSSSYATTATSSSYSSTATSSSYSNTTTSSSYASTATSSSYATNSTSSSYTTTAGSAGSSTSSTTAATASYVAGANVSGNITGNAATATSSSYATTAGTAGSSTSSTTAATASYVLGSNVSGNISGNAATATSSSYATTAGTAGSATSATTAATASYVLGSNVSGNISGNAATATTAATASYVLGSNVSGNISGNAGTVTGGVYTSGDQTISGTKTFAVIKGDSGADYPHSFTNTDAGNTHWTNRSGRMLTSNGTNWASDGKDPIMAIVGSTVDTTRGRMIGITFHNDNNTDNAFSPTISFSAKSNSTSYNSQYASIYGRKTGTASTLDTNWNKGELHFTVHGDNAVSDTPTLRMTQTSSIFGTTITANSYTTNSGQTGTMSGNAYPSSPNSYFGLRHGSMGASSTEYMIISANADTYISCATGSSVYLRPSGNSEANGVVSIIGSFRPETNNSIDLGTASYRWKTVYMMDLSLSNGIGDYTIVEGEEKLYLYNNKNNKVYSFVLQEEDPATATPKKS